MSQTDEFRTSFAYTPAIGLGPEPGITRRDPSDVIRLGPLYYVWYTKTDRGPSGYEATVWYATSPDGKAWTEKGEAIARGAEGEWDEQSVFTPGILVAEGRYYLFYTSVEKPFSDKAKTGIGIAAADSPDGPWRKFAGNPVLEPGGPGEFDSHRADDSCLIVRRGKYWLYYKGREMGLSPRETKMGVAIADSPTGPYVKSPANPVIWAGHEVLVWPHREGVAALVSQGPPSIWYSPDGVRFTMQCPVKEHPKAPGAYRPDAFTDPPFGGGITSGISQRQQKGGMPFLVRFDCHLVAKTTGGEGDVSTDTTAASFGSDLEFLKKHTNVLVLSGEGGEAQVTICPSMQGRVMTSTAGGPDAVSFGWINRDLIASGQTLPHINAYGGEDRFWLGPEGGQFSIFFAKGAAFDLEHWFTPPPIDTEPFDLVSRADDRAAFTRNMHLENYSGARFDLRVDREIRVLSRSQAQEALGVTLPPRTRMVAFQSENTMTNVGDAAWRKPTGLLSIWILGMFRPSPHTTLAIPFRPGPESDRGPVVNDAYFGKIPPDRLVVRDGVLFFKGDGEHRSKIGLSPRRARPILGSYDAASNVLTLVQYTLPAGVTDYVNSMWEIQEEPYAGDAANAYNDGPPEPGAKPLGPFYELESSSPAAALKPGEFITHVHRTFHVQGSEEELDAIAKAALGVGIAEIRQALE